MCKHFKRVAPLFDLYFANNPVSKAFCMILIVSAQLFLCLKQYLIQIRWSELHVKFENEKIQQKQKILWKYALRENQDVPSVTVSFRESTRNYCLLSCSAESNVLARRFWKAGLIPLGQISYNENSERKFRQFCSCIHSTQNGNHKICAKCEVGENKNYKIYKQNNCCKSRVV